MREKFTASAPEPITRRDIESLPLTRRLAWGAAVIERVMALYSDYFLNTYRQRECIDYAQAFANGQTGDRERGNTLADEVAALAEDAEEDGYPRTILGMGGSLAEEVWSGDGKALINAIRSAAYAFAVSRLHRQGLSGLDPQISGASLESIEPAFYRMATAALALAKGSDTLLTAEAIAGLPMDLNVRIVAPSRGSRSAHTQPPTAERDPKLS